MPAAKKTKISADFVPLWGEADGGGAALPDGAVGAVRVAPGPLARLLVGLDDVVAQVACAVTVILLRFLSVRRKWSIPSMHDYTE